MSWMSCVVLFCCWFIALWSLISPLIPFFFKFDYSYCEYWCQIFCWRLTKREFNNLSYPYPCYSIGIVLLMVFCHILIIFYQIWNWVNYIEDLWSSLLKFIHIFFFWFEQFRGYFIVYTPASSCLVVIWVIEKGYC